eukprot:5665527-Amphidinium_carterae.1
MQSRLTWAKTSKASRSTDRQPQGLSTEQRRNTAERLGFPHWPLKNVRAVGRPMRVVQWQHALSEHTQKCDWTSLKVADGVYHVVPVWWKQRKAVDDDGAPSLAVNTGHEVLGGLDGVVWKKRTKESQLIWKRARDCNHRRRSRERSCVP